MPCGPRSVAHPGSAGDGILVRMSSEASRTAVLVCQGRAAADGLLAPGDFADPTAAALLRADERALAEMVRAGDPPDGWAARMPYELVKASAPVMAARTVEIDRAIRSALAGSPAGHVYVAADLSQDDLAPALADAGHDASIRSIWVWEGVVPYLARPDVESSIAAITAASAAGSRLIVNYQSPAVSARLGRMLLRALSRSGGSSPLSGEPIRSTWTPADIARRLGAQRFAVRSDRDLATVAAELGIPADSAQARSLPHGRVAVADLP